MTFKSAAGTVCYVADLARTVAFYETLGFTFATKDAKRATARVNWWWIDFHELDPDGTPPAHAPGGGPRGEGMVMYFSVENVKDAYAELVAKGIAPEGEPAAVRENTEFVVRDPDGYRLAIFKRRR